MAGLSLKMATLTRQHQLYFLAQRNVLQMRCFSASEGLPGGTCVGPHGRTPLRSEKAQRPMEKSQ